MERTGGEPDVVGHDRKAGEYIFCDCSAESPKGCRSICYDREALDSRKEHKSADNALEMESLMGVELLTEEEYRGMQQLGEFDAKTSTWVKAPSEIRKFGGPLFCDRRFNTVFTYRNGSGIVIKRPAASAARCGCETGGKPPHRRGGHGLSIEECVIGSRSGA